MWSSHEYIWPNAQRKYQMRAHLTIRSHFATVGRVDQMHSTFGQTRSAIGQMCASRIWSNVQRILSNVAHFAKCVHI